MFGTLGFPEILFILVLALLVFGPKRLPEVGRTIGRALGEFRRATGDLKRSFDQEVSAIEVEPKSDQPAVVARAASTSDSVVGVSEPASEPESEPPVEPDVEPDSEPDVEPEIDDETRDRDEP